MKIHALCIVKNESDIISQTLINAAKWCDFIYCFDNGSTDGTWETILELSKQHKQIISYKQEDCPFRDSLRNEIFNFYRTNIVEDDWVCRLDADEIYIDDPRIFLSKISKKYQVVVSATLHYYLTEKDVENYELNPSLYADKIPIEKKCYYYINNWSEVRFFKYRSNLNWYAENEWPTNLLGDAYPIRIRLKNFQYRSPQQIQKRLETRRKLLTEGIFPHEAQSNWKAMVLNIASAPCNTSKDAVNHTWKDRVMESAELYYDSNDGKYVLRNDLMPDLYTMSLIWDYRLTLRNFMKRSIKRLKNSKKK